MKSITTSKIRISSLLLAVLTAAALLAPLPARASKDGLVVIDGSWINKDPNDDSDKLYKVRQGDILRISERELNGWYRCLLPEERQGKRYGWINGKNLSHESFARDMGDSGIQRAMTRHFDMERHHITVMGFYDGLWIQPTGEQKTTGLIQDSFFAVTYGLELGYRIKTDWTLIFHAGLHEYASFFAKGVLGGAGVEYSYIHELPWKFGMALGVGGSFGTTIGGKVNAVNVRSDAFFAPVLWGKLTGRYYVLSQLALEAEAGYRILEKSGVALSVQSVDVNLTAPYVGGGLQIEF